MATVNLARFAPTRYNTGKRDEDGFYIFKRDPARSYTERSTGEVYTRRQAIELSTGKTIEQSIAEHKAALSEAEQRGLLDPTSKGRFYDPLAGKEVSHQEALKIAQSHRLPVVRGANVELIANQTPRSQRLLEAYAEALGLDPQNSAQAYDKRFQQLERMLHDYHHNPLTPRQSKRQARAIGKLMWDMGYRNQEDYDYAFY